MASARSIFTLSIMITTITEIKNEYHDFHSKQIPSVNGKDNDTSEK